MSFPLPAATRLLRLMAGLVFSILPAQADPEAVVVTEVVGKLNGYAKDTF